MWSRSLVWLAVTLPQVAVAQGRWQVEIPLRIAAYLPASSLGAIGPAEGRMRPAAMYGAGVELRRRDAPIGVRFAFLNPLSAGARFEPTTQCTGACRPYQDPYPIFQAVSFDLTWRVRTGPFRLQLAAGPGLRVYHIPRYVCDCGQPGADQLQPFDLEQTRVSRHLSAEVRLPLRPFDLSAQLEDYWGSFTRTGRQQHDLVLGLGVHLR
jgi:hypothetical protein